MSKKNRFYATWLVLSFGQILLSAGCVSSAGGAEAEGQLLSEGPAGADPTASGTIPVRISRMFFKQQLTGSIQVTSETRSQEFESPIAWEERPTTLPAPTGAYVADFRDFPGCADYSDLNVNLCFLIAPDVSSVDLSAKKTIVEGVQEFLADKLSKDSACPVSIEGLTFASATKSDDSAFSIRFTAQQAAREATAGCPTQAARPLTIEFRAQSL